jgi:hypothetical protein
MATETEMAVGECPWWLRAREVRAMIIAMEPWAAILLVKATRVGYRRR